MARRDDANKLYHSSSFINNIMRWLFFTNVALSIAVYILNDSVIKDSVVVVQILISIIYVLLNTVDDNYFLYNAESIRRKTAIEDGFGIEITEYKTQEYYNNKITNNSIKFSVNAFESILFSKTTAENMIFKEGIKAGIALLAFIGVCLINKDYGILLIISQTIFSVYFIQDFVRLVVYRSKLENLYKDFYKELITIGIKSEEQKNLILTYALEYEAIKAHYKVRLSEKEFNKHNLETSSRWENIYAKIKIDEYLINNKG